MKTICFDMDGVICKIDSDNYRDRSPIVKTIDTINWLKNNGTTIIIHTGRHFNHMAATKEWLQSWGVKYDYLQLGKPVADLYIDDNGWRFKEWTDKLLKLCR